MAEEPTTLQMPGNVSEGRQLLSRGLGATSEEIAEAYGLDEKRLDIVIRAAINTSSTGEEFLSKAIGELVSLQHNAFLANLVTTLSGIRDRRQVSESIEAFIRKAPEEPTDQEPSHTAVGATSVANQTNDDLIALGREVSKLSAKMTVLLTLAATLLAGGIIGAIALWQEIGGVETRLVREVGQIETRITQQIADVRSEVGEIRGRLSVQGQARAGPP